VSPSGAPARGARVAEGGWRVERAGWAELPALCALAAASFTDPWAEASFAEELRAPEATVIVARDAADVVVGYLAARRAADELHVLSLGVDPPRRRAGIASALLEAVLSEGAAAGARLAHLEVRAGNAEALAFYARFGFQVLGRRRRYYPDGEDALLLAARVPGARAAGGAA
jgi:ribosomal-protein-alanine N-acetyltransferase